MFRRKKPPTISREQMLGSRVAPNTGLRVTRDDRGLVTLGVPMQPSPLLRWFPKLAKRSLGDRRIQLDEVGSFVWDMCNGKTPVLEMIEKLSDRYKMNPKESAVALTSYLSTLTKKGLVSMLVSHPEAEESAAGR